MRNGGNKLKVWYKIVSSSEFSVIVHRGIRYIGKTIKSLNDKRF
jgi:hypothetical protein